MLPPPREHPSFFAKQLIPTHTFRSADTMFAELTGPKREAFLMYLWQEAAKTTGSSLPHVAIADGKLSKLEVVGAIKRGGAEVVVLSMPPAENANEVVFLALVRKAEGVSVFSLERCAKDDLSGISPTDAVLAEQRADGMRLNLGFAPGLDLDAFKRRVGEAIGVSLEGIERSLPEITAAAFVGAGQAGAAGTGKKPSVGPLLAVLLAVRAGVPLTIYLLAKVGIYLGIGLVPGTIYQGLSGVIGICLLIWVYQVHAARPGAGSFSPGWSIGVWFIPVVNFILIPFTIRSAWKTAFGGGGVLLVLLWYVLWLLEMGHQMVIQIRSMPVGGDWTELWTIAVNWGFYVGIAAYGLLWFIVRSVNQRL